MGLGCSGASPMAGPQANLSAPEADKSPSPIPLPPKYEVTQRVQLDTSLGTVVIGLYGKQAPATVANFLQYVDEGFYKGKIFHRVIPGFVIQGGGFDENLGRAQTREPIALELIPGLKHEPGILSMARTSVPKSATSQFFICAAEAPQLNGGYCAFGKVESGMEVVEKISMVPTGKRQADEKEPPMDDVPLEPVVILSVRRL
jgi:cyclophilin family peptidyl-prolyl cis-trans isomerase